MAIYSGREGDTAHKLYVLYMFIRQYTFHPCEAWLAHLGEYETLNLRDVGLSPIMGEGIVKKKELQLL